MKQQHNINDEFLDTIISVAYGDAKLSEKIRVHLAARKDPRVKELLNDYKSTAESLALLREEKCPEYIVNTADKVTGTGEQKAGSAWIETLGFFFKRPVLSASAAVVVIAILVSVLLIRQPDVQPAYSQAQVELAQKQVEESLGMVGKVFKETKYTLATQILLKKVSPPLHESFTIINDLFKGG